MTASTLTRPAPRNVSDELDHASRSGPLQGIRITPCPEALLRMRQAWRQADPDLSTIARIASSDVAMSAALLKAANSPLISSGQAVQTVGQAMNRLGLNQTAMVMTGFLTEKAVPAQGTHLQRFWQRARKQAEAMQFIARKLPGMSVDTAHTYGLFCHVGIPVMLHSLPGYPATLMAALGSVDQAFTAVENAAHRTDHAVVGALLARMWQLAPEVVTAIRLHHDAEVLGDSHTAPEVQTLVAAGRLAESLMMRHEGLEPDVEWREGKDQVLAWLHIEEAEVELWEDDLSPWLDAA